MLLLGLVPLWVSYIMMFIEVRNARRTLLAGLDLSNIDKEARVLLDDDFYLINLFVDGDLWRSVDIRHLTSLKLIKDSNLYSMSLSFKHPKGLINTIVFRLPKYMDAYVVAEDMVNWRKQFILKV